MISGLAFRLAAVVTVSALLALSNPAAAQAITQPSVDPDRVPVDGRPGPEHAMRQNARCRTAIATPEPDVSQPAPGFAMLSIERAWQYSTGSGVRVAVIDTGVTPSARLPVIPGGDYVEGGDGLSDCDVHGTVVAALIAAAPEGSSMPSPMPPAQDPAAPTPAPPATPVDGNGFSPGPDGVVGVAPHATVISIRQSSDMFEPIDSGSGDMEARKRAGTVATLARAVVHAANLGASVINVSVTACMSAADSFDQRALGAAVWYAATVKDAVIVAAAGNEGEGGCAKNPAPDPLNTVDPRDWRQVRTISAPSWYADYVLSVGAVDSTGAPISGSLAGPWVGAAAPGVGIVGVTGRTGSAVNAYAPARPGESAVPIAGTSFAAAYVSGVAALVRARFPGLSAHQVIHRIHQTAHNPPRGVDNQVGYGVVDPVAALTFNVAAGDRSAPGAQTRVLTPQATPAPPDHRARAVALVLATGAGVCGLLAAAVSRARRTR